MDETKDYLGALSDFGRHLAALASAQQAIRASGRASQHLLCRAPNVTMRSMGRPHMPLRST